MIRVVVIDDHEIVRKGLVAYLETDEEIDVVGQADGGHRGAEIAIDRQPDVVLMDLIMDQGTGIEATQTIMDAYPECRVIVLTSYYDDEMLFPALEAGAFSYMLKTSSADEIVTAIKKAASGENVMTPKVMQKMISGYKTDSQELHEALTEREMDVLLCIGQGMTNQEISEKLYIGIKTVKTHVSHILSKLEVNDRTQAAVYVHKKNLL